LKDIELFAFDLDGTLLDTAPDFFKSVNILRQKYNLDEESFFIEFNEKILNG